MLKGKETKVRPGSSSSLALWVLGIVCLPASGKFVSLGFGITDIMLLTNDRIFLEKWLCLWVDNKELESLYFNSSSTCFQLVASFL